VVFIAHFLLPLAWLAISNLKHRPPGLISNKRAQLSRLRTRLHPEIYTTVSNIRFKAGRDFSDQLNKIESTCETIE
jgi:hypothetical protein